MVARPLPAARRALLLTRARPTTPPPLFRRPERSGAPFFGVAAAFGKLHYERGVEQFFILSGKQLDTVTEAIHGSGVGMPLMTVVAFAEWFFINLARAGLNVHRAPLYGKFWLPPEARYQVRNAKVRLNMTREEVLELPEALVFSPSVCAVFEVGGSAGDLLEVINEFCAWWARGAQHAAARGALLALFDGAEIGARGAKLERLASAAERAWSIPGKKMMNTAAATLKRQITRLQPTSLRARGEVFDGLTWTSVFLILYKKKSSISASWTLPGVRQMDATLSLRRYKGAGTVLRRIRKLNAAERAKFEYVDTPVRQRFWRKAVAARGVYFI